MRGGAIGLLLASVTGFLVGVMLTLLAVGVVRAAPSTAGDASEGSPHRLYGAPQAEVGSVRSPSSGAPRPRGASGSPKGSPVAREVGAETAISGTATWYCGNGSPCTHGYQPSDMVAAIDPSLGIPKGTWLRVRHGSRSVEVRAVDVCACPGRRVIDLTSGAFARLAPLSRGVIAVSLEEVGPAVTIPPTDTSEVKP